jgi:uncharacterized tellurite resistance protein B-like protein
VDIDTTAIRRLRDRLLSRVDVGAGDEVAAREHALHDAIRRRVEPFAETMYLVMIADGDPALVERKTLAAAIDVLTDGQLSAGDVDAMLQRFDENARRDGSEARVAQLGDRISNDRDDRETAFALGAVVALADDHVHVLENRVLEWIKEHYGISDRQMAKLLETID